MSSHADFCLKSDNNCFSIFLFNLYAEDTAAQGGRKRRGKEADGKWDKQLLSECRGVLNRAAGKVCKTVHTAEAELAPLGRGKKKKCWYQGEEPSWKSAGRIRGIQRRSTQ
jgi:hypothetical protein